ncbi:uncharacterized protein AC631_06010 [Debaryomyces fabryi]|uniref:Uncharacterized protein n=1 Tax=Debaryomyces fabryi TaxID=58627 RepID=A0A0V1PPR6_9ASCO|nr:uncharacterized protein AC631_06010 [Debaryomyces fabryi]KRZ98230.1 hypothetical protein AC631_06010 [Debaryomyces fabryi]
MEVADTVMEDAVDTDMEDVVIPLDLTLPSTPRASSVLVPMPSHPETPLASSPLSVPQVVEPPSPSSSPASSRLLSSRTVIEYISDSEASVSGEDYRTSYYERHHDNFDCSDDEDYIDKPIKKRKAITGKLRRRSEVLSEDETEPSKKQKKQNEPDSSLVVRGSANFMSHAYVVSAKKDGVPITYKQAMLSR